MRILLTPDPRATLLQREKPNSTTRLLAATYSYKIFNKFGSGTTQRGFQETYQVKAKQLATCITGHKYLGGADHKRKASGSDEGAPSSKKSPQTSKEDIHNQILFKHQYHFLFSLLLPHHLADRSLPGEWWVAAGRGANYPVRPAKTPTTHLISSCYSTASHLTSSSYHHL